MSNAGLMLVTVRHSPSTDVGGPIDCPLPLCLNGGDVEIEFACDAATSARSVHVLCRHRTGD